MKRTAAHGSIFAVPLPDGTYIFGRVMLDVLSVIKRRLLPHDSALLFFNGTYLVEMYSLTPSRMEYSPSPVLIPGAFVQSKEVGKKWPIMGWERVDPQAVEFPEGLSMAGGELMGLSLKDTGAFHCGEIRCPVPFTEQDVFNRIKVWSCWSSAGGWANQCLVTLGRRPDWKGVTLADEDLRFSLHRAEVYEHLPFPMEMSYFEKQKQLGLHLERFYE